MGISHARIAAAVLELLRAEDRWDVLTCARTRIPRDAAVAVVDVPYLARSSRPLRVPAIVLLRSDVEHEAAQSLAPTVRAWLRTFSTGDELLAAVDTALAVRVAVAAPAPAFAAPESDAELASPALAASDALLLALGTGAGAVALAFIWQLARP
ncbi:MAG: hypothetical protein KGK34_02970 [Chloroflexota bacterium]|nr:hypothetical protein [Chloroflexota bacterium]